MPTLQHCTLPPIPSEGPFRIFVTNLNNSFCEELVANIILPRIDGCEVWCKAIIDAY